MKSKSTQDALMGDNAAKIIGSIFRARRDLVPRIKKRVIQGTGLTLEQADLLVDLWGAKARNWNEPKAIEGGWVTFSALKESLVHAREQLTRRLSELEAGGYVEISSVPKEEAKALGMDSKSKKTRILPKGEQKAKEIFDRYGVTSLDLINRLPGDLREQAQTILRFNEAVIKELRG